MGTNHSSTVMTPSTVIAVKTISLLIAPPGVLVFSIGHFLGRLGSLEFIAGPGWEQGAEGVERQNHEGRLISGHRHAEA